MEITDVSNLNLDAVNFLKNSFPRSYCLTISTTKRGWCCKITDTQLTVDLRGRKRSAYAIASLPSDKVRALNSCSAEARAVGGSGGGG